MKADQGWQVGSSGSTGTQSPIIDGQPRVHCYSRSYNHAFGTKWPKSAVISNKQPSPDPGPPIAGLEGKSVDWVPDFILSILPSLWPSFYWNNKRPVSIAFRKLMQPLTDVE